MKQKESNVNTPHKHNFIDSYIASFGLILHENSNALDIVIANVMFALAISFVLNIFNYQIYTFHPMLLFIFSTFFIMIISNTTTYKKIAFSFVEYIFQ